MYRNVTMTMGYIACSPDFCMQVYYVDADKHTFYAYHTGAVVTHILPHESEEM